MSTQVATSSENFLHQHGPEAWAQTLADLLPSIHEVDRHATQIWFAFFPLALLRALEQSPDPEKLAQALLLQGNYFLKDQIDSSHKFLYGHRSWPAVKQAVAEFAGTGATPVGAQSLDRAIRDVAARVAAQTGVEESLVVGITAVAFMTLQQVGAEAFKAAPGTIHIDAKHARKSAAQVLKERARDDGQGLFGFLRTTDKKWTVVFDENDESRRFKMVQMQEIASGAATDHRDWHTLDARCTVNEGPIPVQCRSASCGTCWVGVLGGADNLTEVGKRERRQMPDFGYIHTDEPRPLIRLACQAQGTGPVSIVIPPWNGVFGKYLRNAHDASPDSGNIDAKNSDAPNFSE